MSGLAWIILNIALVIGAAYGTIKVRNTPAPKPLQLEEPAKPEAESPHKASTRNEKPAESKSSAPRPLATNASMDDLWKQTLFFPTRTEETEEGNAEQTNIEQAALAARNIEFELVGIAQINVVGEEDPVPVAILRSKIGSERGGRPGTRRGNPRDRNNPRGNQPQPSNTAADSQSKSEEKQVFRVGEKINQTGYLLVNINADEKMVEVSRNGETVKLYINFIGEEATQRREAVSQATAQKHQEQARRIAQEQARRIEQENRDQQQATQVTNTQPTANANPGGPPPPPGAPASNTSPDNRGTSGPASPDARAERLRRIAEARQQQQQARQQQNANNQNQNAAPPPPPPAE